MDWTVGTLYSNKVCFDLYSNKVRFDLYSNKICFDLFPFLSGCVGGRSSMNPMVSVGVSLGVPSVTPIASFCTRQICRRGLVDRQ